MIFTYECECGARQDWSGSSADKPETLTCQECGQQAAQLLCFNLVMKQSPMLKDPDAWQKALVRKLYEQKGQAIQQNAGRIRDRDRAIVESAKNRISAERSRPKVHGSVSAVEQAVVPLRFVREYEMNNGQGSWNTVMKDKKAVKKTLKDAGLWAGS